MRIFPFILLIALLFLAGCSGNNVTFEVPQPNRVKNETTFPKSFLGRYILLEHRIDTIILEDHKTESVIDTFLIEVKRKMVIILGQTFSDSFPVKRLNTPGTRFHLKGKKIFVSSGLGHVYQGKAIIKHDSVFAK